MAVTLAKFRATFPELDSTVTDAEFERADRVATQVIHGTEEQKLWALAHLATVKDTDLTGDTVSIQIGGQGGIARDYKVMSRTERDVFWSTTHYGRLYLTLLRQTPVTGIGLLAVH